MPKKRLQALAAVLVCTLFLLAVVSGWNRMENLEQRVERLEQKTEPHIELIHKR